MRVLLVEAGPMLGGNSTLGGVNTWEPGIGGPGFHSELYERLLQVPGAIALSRTTKFCSSDAPWSLSQPQTGLIYRDSLGRAGVKPEDWTRVTFEPGAMAHMMAAMLVSTGNVELRLNARFVAAQTDERWVDAIEIESDGLKTRCVPEHACRTTRKGSSPWLTMPWIHGEGHLCSELDVPYGVPFECLLPREFDNLLVACRGASFSHLTASSCRLSRTMMQLGHAAGLAAFETMDSNIAPSEVGENLQYWLTQDMVALSPSGKHFSAGKPIVIS